jgi:putative transposase
MWVEKSSEQLDSFRTRPIDQHEFIGLQVDGIHLKDEVMIVIALGIDRQGYKHALDFEQGSSESAETVGGLLARLHERGLREPKGRRLLVQRDGSAAIAKAIYQYFPNALQQECVVHLQRNVKDKIKRKDRDDLDLHFKRFREAQGKEAGEEAWDGLFGFVNERNAVAAKALGERKEVLLTVHRLELPATLNRTFLSTNIVENAIKNWRQHTGNIKLWNEKKDMVSR